MELLGALVKMGGFPFWPISLVSDTEGNMVGLHSMR